MASNDRDQPESNEEPARKRIRTDAPAVSAPEENVGITQFLSNHDGFDGIIKYRYSDFLVNEISSNGSVVRLTDLTCPDYNQKKATVSTVKQAMNTGSSHGRSRSPRTSPSRRKPSNGYEIYRRPMTVKPFPFLLNLTKEQRTAVHHFVRSIDVNLKSELINGSIQVTYQRLSQQARRASDQWPDKSKPYLKFVLYKENRDTMDAVQSIAACVNLNTSLFQYAGIKDKRGKTCQEITLHKVLPSRFKNLNQRLPAIKVGNFSLCETPLRLGLLQGNRFEIFIRNISTDSSEHIKTCVNSWIEKGFINYFGLQRFGSRTLATQTVGKYLLRHDWSLAIDAILAYDETITQDWLRQLLSEWNKTRDIKTILDGTIPYRRSVEVDLLRGLQKNDETNLIGALSCIPRNTRLLYLHAYQSMIWNKIVSRRLATFGMDVLVGDLFIADADNESNVSFVTEQNQKDVKLEQVVLPLPGYDVKYPLNEIHPWYRDLLTEDGINIDQMRYQVKDYSLPGNYRSFIIYPGQVEHRLVHYDNVDDDPLQSDYDRLLKHIVCESKRYVGLVLAFSLPKSSYATMALREILHRNESALQTQHQHQQQQSVPTASADELADTAEDEIEDVVL